MNKISKIKITFKCVEDTENDRVLESVYSRIFQKAYENIVSKKSKGNYNNNYGNK